MDPVELVILVGIQASGKTTFFRRHLQGRYVHVSLDNWRGKSNVRARERAAILEGLRAATPGGALRGVAVDNTNITARTRGRYFQYAAEFAADAGREVQVDAYFFDAPLSACQVRNEQRPKDAPVGSPYHVPAAAIAAFFSRLEKPTANEGFGKVFSVTIAPDGQFAVALIAQRKQENAPPAGSVRPR